VSLKLNDVKYFIKYTFNSIGPIFYLEKLVNFLLSKEKGGARTHHQISNVFSIMMYIIELNINKLQLNENSIEFKEKLNVNQIDKLFTTMIQIIKENLKYEAEITANTVDTNDIKEMNDNTNDDTNDVKNHKISNKIKKQIKHQAKEVKSKNVFFFIGLINFAEKYISFLNKCSLKLRENSNFNKNIKKFTNILAKVIENYDIKNMEKKLSEINEKSLTI